MLGTCSNCYIVISHIDTRWHRWFVQHGGEYPKQPAIPLPPAGPSAEEFRTFDIVRAVQYGAYERVRELVEGGHDVNQPDRENVSMLHWAAINNRAEIVK